MYSDVVKYIRLLARYQLTQNQFLALYLVYTRGMKLVRLYNNTMPDALLSNEAKEDLIARGFLEIPDNKHGKKKIKLGAKSRELFLEKHLAADEVWSAYPGFVTSENNRSFPLKGIPKTQFMDIYWQAYKGSHNEHKDILEDIDYGNTHGLINVRIDNFFHSEMYMEFRKLRKHNNDSDYDTETNIADFNEF